MNWITLKEAANVASSVPNAPKTLSGLRYAAERYKFIKYVKKGDLYKFPLIHDIKLFKYFHYIDNHRSLTSIAKEVGLTIGGMLPTIFIRIGIKGVKKYGKTYFTRKERNKIIQYFKNKRRNIKET